MSGDGPSASAIVDVAWESVMIGVAILVLICLSTLVPPALAVWRFTYLSRRAFRAVQRPRSVLVGAGLAVGLAGYALLFVALVGFWLLVTAVALSALFNPDGPSVLLPVTFVEIPFLLVWLVSEPLIYVGCRAKRANLAPAA